MDKVTIISRIFMGMGVVVFAVICWNIWLTTRVNTTASSTKAVKLEKEQVDAVQAMIPLSVKELMRLYAVKNAPDKDKDKAVQMCDKFINTVRCPELRRWFLGKLVATQVKEAAVTVDKWLEEDTGPMDDLLEDDNHVNYKFDVSALDYVDLKLLWQEEPTTSN